VIRFAALSRSPKQARAYGASRLSLLVHLDSLVATNRDARSRVSLVLLR
jgi:hypothetical protein